MAFFLQKKIIYRIKILLEIRLKTIPHSIPVPVFISCGSGSDTMNRILFERRHSDVRIILNDTFQWDCRINAQD
ncbi:unnamed protein product [Ceutorhynchus assimilis]|uniref:Uncharacterized protein n=1 Tax=Ceutorhynchus assimilis TaxID=467358 RepID=A0A9N9MLW7_9CUCU|nr:unnamed protein product [Ceutorhynchus assimilis]